MRRGKIHNLGFKINSVETRFKDPYDNLLLAILLQAAKDCESQNASIAKEAHDFISTEGRELWEHLKTRPLNEKENYYYLHGKFKNVPHGTIKRRKRRIRKVV